MTAVKPPDGRDNADLEGCTKNHCHGMKRDGTGTACHRPAGWGTDHQGIARCKLHGGSTSSHRTKAKADQARIAAATYGLPIDIDPAKALLEEVHRTAGHVAWLGALLAEMDEGDLVWGVVEETDSTGREGGSTTKRQAKPSVWLDLYQKERRHLAAVTRDALGADASGRVAAVFEQIGATYIQLIERVLDRLDLTETQRAAIPGVLVEELQALPGSDRP